MPDLSFQIEAAQAVSFAVAPLMGFELRVTNAGGEPVHTIALRSQIQIEVTRRRYGSREQERLQDLFGEPSRWGQTVRNMLWTHARVVVPGLPGACHLRLQCGRYEILPGTRGRRDPPVLSVQRHGVLSGRRELTGCADFVGQRGEIPPAGRSLEADDGLVLPKLRVALPWPGCIRTPERIQAAQRNPDVGRDAGKPAAGDRAGGAPRSSELVERIANAVLYEGYILYPYRPSSVKNQRRFTFGVLVPPAYSGAQSGTETASMRTECLVRGGPATSLDVRVRFLQVIDSAGQDAHSREASWRDSVER